jgi:hypothetical protein
MEIRLRNSTVVHQAEPNVVRVQSSIERKISHDMCIEYPTIAEDLCFSSKQGFRNLQHLAISREQKHYEDDKPDTIYYGVTGWRQPCKHR